MVACGGVLRLARKAILALVAGAAVLVAAGISPTSAFACNSLDTGVAGIDNHSTHYGDGANLYVSTQATIDNVVSSTSRSIFVINTTSGNDVEVGWASIPAEGLRHPFIYTEHVLDGADSGPQYYGGYTVNYDSNVHVKVQDSGFDGYFKYYVDGDSTAFRTSVQMPFHAAYDYAQSEHHDSCSSIWAHIYGLEYFNSSSNWVDWGSLDEAVCSATAWRFFPKSTNEFYVDQDNGYC